MDSPSAKSRAPLGPSAERETAEPESAREEFCRFLRAERERKSMSIEDIARVTKIPEHSLRRLEAGEFHDLPADVFVRGFLRSYARCVGVDADDVVKRYAACGGLTPAPVASAEARVAAEQFAALAARDDRGEVVLVSGGAASAPAPGRPPTATPVASRPAPAPKTAPAPKPARAVARARPGTGSETRTVVDKEKERRTRKRQRTARGAVKPNTRRAETREQDRGARRAAERRMLVRARAAGREFRRGPIVLAVGVVVLLVAAFLLMSHLLQRPSGP